MSNFKPNLSEFPFGLDVVVINDDSMSVQRLQRTVKTEAETFGLMKSGSK